MPANVTLPANATVASSRLRLPVGVFTDPGAGTGPEVCHG